MNPIHLRFTIKLIASLSNYLTMQRIPLCHRNRDKKVSIFCVFAWQSCQLNTPNFKIWNQGRIKI